MATNANPGNVKITTAGNKVTIEIDLTKDLGPSASGKTNVVATTHGNQPIGDTGVILGLNAYRRK